MERGGVLPARNRRNSSGVMSVVAMLVALVFIVGPLVVSSRIPAVSQIILVGFGVFLLLIGAIIVTITRLYRKTAADEAFVRTGMGGQKAIIDGGALVIPVVHEVVLVSLQTMKLAVRRVGDDALITGDYLRADVVAEFFIKVQKTVEDVLAAATSLGQNAVDPGRVEATVFEKLVNALRTVAATKQLAELNAKRDEFASAVQEIVKNDLRHNGLTLESVTISKLDQTPTAALRPNDNVFDAQGTRRIAEITNEARIARNQIERDAERSVKEQDVETAKFVYNQEVERASAEAARDREIQLAKARAIQEVATATAEQQRLSEIALVQKTKAVEVAEVERQQTVSVANTVREQAVETAGIEKNKAVELAERDKQIAVAQKEKERATAEAARLAEEAVAEKNRQAVATVEVTASAEREKQKTIIEAEATFEQEKLAKNIAAEVEAYALRTKATAEKEAAQNRADARVISANADADARLVAAKAEKEAQEAEAAGKQAADMVPVNVRREQVEVERKELENKSAFGSISRDLTIRLAEIEASRDVQIATANAMGHALEQAKLTLWGTPEQAAEMSQAFIKGQNYAALADGLMTGVSGNGGAVADIAKVLSSVIEHLTGSKVDDISKK